MSVSCHPSRRPDDQAIGRSLERIRITVLIDSRSRIIRGRVLLAGEEESAARGLLAAFAWAAPDIAGMVNASAVLEAIANVLHWQAHSVFVLVVESGDPADLRCVLVRAPAERAERITDRLGSSLRLAGPAARRLVSAADGRARSQPETWDGSDAGPPWVCFEIRVAGELKWLLLVEGRGFTVAALDGVAAFARLAETCLTRIAERETLVADLVEQQAHSRRTIATERLSVLGEAAAVLAHEMRNPLGTISNALALLGRVNGADHPVALSIVRDEVGRLDTFVHDLLELARPVDPACRRVEVGRLVIATLDRARKELNGTHILVPPPATPEGAEITGDPALLALALANLVRNAAQASPRDSEIRVVIAAAASEVIVSVEDDGPGVATAMRERIFDPFFTTRPVGTGLGLSIVKRLVEAHGGSVRVGTSSSGGARFDLVFARSW